MHDMYLVSCLMRGRTRAKGAAVARRLLHADVDGQLDIDRVRKLPGRSPSLRAHLVTATSTFQWPKISPSLNTPLCAVGWAGYLRGAPGKISDNDFLRPAGTFNHKPTLAGGDPAPMSWLVRP